jgi:hypothetical protein
MGKRAKPPPLPAEDSALFRAAVGNVVPIITDRIHYEPPPPPAIPQQHLRDEAGALADAMHEPLSIEHLLEGGSEPVWTANGVSKNVFRASR